MYTNFQHKSREKCLKQKTVAAHSSTFVTIDMEHPVIQNIRYFLNDEQDDETDFGFDFGVLSRSYPNPMLLIEAFVLPNFKKKGFFSRENPFLQIPSSLSNSFFSIYRAKLRINFGAEEELADNE